MKILSEKTPDTVAAVVEFETKDDAQSALTRDQKRLGENIVDVQLYTNSTLWVTNFPATADDEYIRSLFGKVRILCLDTIGLDSADSFYSTETSLTFVGPP